MMYFRTPLVSRSPAHKCQHRASNRKKAAPRLEPLEDRCLLSAYLVKDLDTTTMSSLDWTRLIEVNGLLFFTASAPGYGRELWATDGTEAGSYLVKDINPGRDGSIFEYGSSALNDPLFVNVGGTLFFVAYTPATGWELWKSDGTEPGTVLVKDINPVDDGSQPSHLANIGGTLFFTAVEPDTGRELWKSDGTEEGTVLVKDIASGPSHGFWSLDGGFTEVSGTAFFVARTQSSDTELWKSDGTEQGTALVKDIAPGLSGSGPQNLTNVSGTLFFSAMESGTGNELWKSDGTESGTYLVRDLATGGSSSYPDNLTNVNGLLYFSALGSGVGSELWKSDGTEKGTVLVKDIVPGPGGASPSGLTLVGDTLFFSADTPATGWELWKSDGTEKGTVLVKDIIPGSGGAYNLRWLTNGGGTLFFAYYLSPTSGALWKSDGTEQGTLPVKDFPQGGPGQPTNAGGTLFFVANEGVHGYELWRSDGTKSGTVLVIDPSPGTRGAEPGELTARDDALFFVPQKPYPSALYTSDGTEAGTRTVAAVPGIAEVRNVNGMLFGRGARYVCPPMQPCRLAYSLWRSDGTAQGTQTLREVGGDNRLGNLTPVQDTLFFTWGGVLWKSDGTVAGTVLVRDRSAANLTNVGGTLFFTSGTDLWKSDGTPEGTVLVRASLLPADLTAVDSTLYFTASEPATGRELWKSDGTSLGTVLVRDINPGPADSFGPSIGFLTKSNGMLFFSADDGQNGVELWKSDGTEAGTVLVADLSAGPNGSWPAQFTEVNGQVYFAAIAGAEGYELWASDGTAKGTYLVRDINPGKVGSYPGELRNFNGVLFFTAEDGATGRELWASDGTEDGTVLVQDILPGPGGSTPEHLTVVNGLLFFSADDGFNGRELWAYTFDGGPGRFRSLTGRPRKPVADVNTDLTSAGHAVMLPEQTIPRRVAAATAEREQRDRLFAVTVLEEKRMLPQLSSLGGPNRATAGARQAADSEDLFWEVLVLPLG